MNKSPEILAQELFSLLNQIGAIRTTGEETIYISQLNKCFNEIRTHKKNWKIVKEGYFSKFSKMQQKEILEITTLKYNLTPPF